MTAIAKVKLTYKNSVQAIQQRIKRKRNQYDWADNLFFDGHIKASLLHTLKAIIACLKLDRPTLEQINAARTKSCAQRFAQCDPITIRWLRGQIKQLEKLGYIKVQREVHCWYSRNSYSISFVADELANSPQEQSVTCPQEQTSPSLSSSSFLEEKKKENIKLLNPEAAEHLAIQRRHTEQYRLAVETLKNEGVVEPDRGLPDSLYYPLHQKYQVQLAGKILELEQRL